MAVGRHPPATRVICTKTALVVECMVRASIRWAV